MKKYTYNEVLEASIKYFNGDELAAKVFTDKYALQNLKGEYLELTPDDMHRRLAKEFARIEKKYPNPMSEEEIYQLLKKNDQNDLGMGYIVPQGSPMSAIGNPYKLQSMSNCFVIDSPKDSYGGILFTDQQQAQIMKRRGGVGFDVSTIRPRGLSTANAAGTTDGIGVFIERFSNTCREVAQGGRRGALMLTISIQHPEIETFINIKRDLKKVTGANISIRITDDFMNAVKQDKEFTLQWPCEVPLSEAKVTRVVRAKDIWDQIVDSAWASAEPGLLFWDTAKRNTPADIYEHKGYGSKSTNPCGEIVLSPGDSCRLIVLDLTKFVNNPFQSSANFDYTKFDFITQKAQRLMDDLVDLEIEAVDKIIQKIKEDPEPDYIKEIEINLWNKIKEVGSNGRRTGLGITGMGDTLAMLNVKYGSDESLKAVDSIYKCLSLAAYRSSINMAKERGAFPAFEYDEEKNHKFIKSIIKLDKNLEKDWAKYGRRNIALTTTAPTGSVSTLTQTTSGIEPVFLLSYVRRKKVNPNDKSARVDFTDQMGDKWQEFTVYHHGLKKWMDITEQSDITKSPYYGATANEIDWLASVDLQANAQRYICHSISKTCNLHESATKDLVSQVYMRAWETGCKGFTVYRDKCRDGVLVNASDSKVKSSKDKNNRPMEIEVALAPKRPQELSCEIKKVKISGEAWTIFVGLLNGKPYEIFGGLSKYVDIPNKYKVGKIVKNGKVSGITTYNLIVGDGDDEMLVKDIANVFENGNYGAFTRTISLALRHGTPVQFIVEQLQKDKNSDITSFSKVIARVLKTYIADGTKSSAEKKCPSCGQEDSFTYQEHCLKCVNCGWSKC